MPTCFVGKKKTTAKTRGHGRRKGTSIRNPFIFFHNKLRTVFVIVVDGRFMRKQPPESLARAIVQS